MRILVAGGFGQVGRALADQSLKMKVDLIALDRTELDIACTSSITSAFDKFKPDILINAAAYTSVDDAETESKLAFEINEHSTARLADACARARIPMIHLSTDYVFDGLKQGLYNENDPVNPLTVYGLSKERGERMLRKILTKHIILRTSWIYGIWGNNFVKTMLRLATTQSRLEVVSDQTGGPTSARSISEILLKIISRYERTGDLPWGTYHFSQKPYVTWNKLAEHVVSKGKGMGLIFREVEVHAISSRELNARACRPCNSCLDTSLIENTFDLEQSYWTDEIANLLIAIENRG